jgi:hypothetical protein
MRTEITLPNGCTLRPGECIRLSREQAFEIPDALIEELGLELEESAASPGSEVIVWPKAN